MVTFSFILYIKTDNASKDIEFVSLKSKTYSYLIDADSEDKKTKDTKNVPKKTQILKLQKLFTSS